MGFLSGVVTGRPNNFTATVPVNDFRATAPVNAFQANGAALDEASYAEAIRRAQENALAVNPQQQSLVNTLSAAVAGNGPSVAENQLRRATDQNVQQTAGLIASQRGMNPALAARIAAGAGARASQDVAGQAATLRAQEQIAARGQLGDVLNQMGQGATSITGTAGTLQNAQNTGRIQNTLGREGINAGVAAGNQGADLEAQRINAGVAAGNQQANLDAQRINAGVGANNAEYQSRVTGGLLSGAGAALGSVFSDERVKRDVVRHADEVIPGVPRATFEYRGQPGVEYEGVIAQDVERVAPGLVGETREGVKVVPPALAPRPVAVVPGRARVAGDSPKNDTVPILASPEEIVLPRSVTKAPDAPERAAEFVAAIKAKKKGNDGSGYGKVLAAQRELDARLARLERRAPPDADLGEKRDADLPEYQLPVYRGETAAGRYPPRLAGMADGGEVSPSLVGALRAWLAAEGPRDEKAREVADAAHAKLPEMLSARSAVEKKRTRLAALEAATAGN
jgi:hypothetical protein